MSEQLAGMPASILGPEPSLLTIIALLLLWISGAFERALAEAFLPAAPARPPSIHLARPRLVPMSAERAAIGSQTPVEPVSADDVALISWSLTEALDEVLKAIPTPRAKALLRLLIEEIRPYSGGPGRNGSSRIGCGRSRCSRR